MYHRYLKRFLDLSIAVPALVVLSPVMMITALAIRLEDGGPALFRQQRVGKEGELFRINKFRSMPVQSESIPSVAAGTLVITRIGKIIRRTNIDELPQLFNVIAGDMSIVGPRPALPVQTELLALRMQTGATRCKPGLTGLAQINSYDNMPETEKAAWDGKYAASLSLGRDVAIILKTFGYLARRPPVY